MNPLKIVIVAANCFPTLGPRAHRATELAKELSKRGHNVHLFALLGNYDYTEVHNKTGILFKDLGKPKFGLSDNTGKRNENILNRIIKKIAGEILAFPYIELFFMVKKALNKETNIDLLITIAHPHPIHWAIPFLKQKNYKTWIADCGDPYMGDPLNFHPFYFKYIEKNWCKTANYITIPIEEARKAYYPEFRNKIRVIPQGFNFDDVKLATYRKNDVPTFAYSGVIYKGKRDPRKFFEYLSTLESDFRFVVYTKNKKYFLEFQNLLSEKLVVKSYIPRLELLYELSKMDFLINIKNESGVQQPSKLIDYALTKRPVLEISTFFEKETIFNNFLNEDYSEKLLIANIENFDIKNVVDSFLILNN